MIEATHQIPARCAIYTNNYLKIWAIKFFHIYFVFDIMFLHGVQYCRFFGIIPHRRLRKYKKNNVFVAGNGVNMANSSIKRNDNKHPGGATIEEAAKTSGITQIIDIPTKEIFGGGQHQR